MLLLRPAGDHALGFVGDMIDALSISTTTFGVCTSLGLGVTQLSRGLGKFLLEINCPEKKVCEDAGGRYDITGYGAQNCFDIPEGNSLEVCTGDWLTGSKDDADAALYTIIMLITCVATLSVISGLDRGIKFLSQVPTANARLPISLCAPPLATLRLSPLTVCLHPRRHRADDAPLRRQHLLPAQPHGPAAGLSHGAVAFCLAQ